MNECTGSFLRSVHLYATREDFLLLFERSEAVMNLVFVDSGPYHVPFKNLFKKDEQSIRTYTHGAGIPNLGVASHPTSNFCSHALVGEPGVQLTPSPRHPEGGKTYFEVRLSYNLDVVEIQLGGLLNGVLMASSMTIYAESASARKILALFRKVMKKEFTKVRGNHVGPAALGMLKSGKRLTFAQQSPPEYDLALESEA